MKKLLLLNYLIFSFFLSSGQILFQGDKNYFEFANEMDSLMTLEQIDKSSAKKFNRNHLFYKNRLYPSGQLSDYQLEIKNFLQNYNFTTDTLYDLPEWYPIGSPQIINQADDYVLGNGRVSFIKFHPFDLSTIYVGSPTGTVWVSNNDGVDWEILSDELLTRGYSDMVIDTLTQSMFLLSGDFDGRDAPFYGILKSQDDGQTWEIIDSLEISFGKKLMAHPNIENLLYLIAQDGFYYSFNGGYSWEKSSSLPSGNEKVDDLDFDINQDSTLYVLADDTLYQSLDLGLNFQYLYDLDSIKSGPTELVIHPISNTFYIGLSPYYTINLSNYGSDTPGILRSTNQGESFDLLPGTDTLRANQQYYNMIFGVSPQSDERIFIGWVDSYFQDSINIWNKANKNQYIHPDYHCFAFDPKNEDCLLVGNDGGLYRSCDFGQSWENISGNMNLTQVYTFGNSNTCEDLIMIGTQDNGTAVIYEEVSTSFYGGDGFSCGFSATSNDTAFFSLQNQFAYRLDSFYQFLDTYVSSLYTPSVKSIRPLDVNYGSSFQTKIKFSNTKSGLLYYIDRDKIFRSTNYGKEYEEVTSGGSTVYDLELSPINSDFMNLTYRYFTYNPVFVNKIYIKYSQDKGNTWTSMSIHHPSFDTLQSVKPIPQALTFDPLNEEKIWVVLNKNNYHRILFTTDFGVTWEDYSEGLPNISMNDILYQPYSNDALYLATDMGIYFRNDTLDSWIPFDNNLPQTIFTELKISDVAEKLRASSYGSGLWETDLFDSNQHPPFSNFDCHTIELCPGEEFQWTHSSTYSPDSVVWIFEGGTPEISYENNPTIIYENGGLFSTTLITINDFGKDTLVRNHIMFIANDDIQINSQQIDNSTYQLTVNNNFDSIQWNTGETTLDILVTESGWYSASTINNMGCIITDSIYIDFIPTAIDEIENFNCLIFPNPSLGQIQIDCNLENQNLKFQIINLLGQVMLSDFFRNETTFELPEGIYTIQIFNEKDQNIKKSKMVVLKEK
ncbi:MAG: T9SS type A sorting domain-containing protein [Saprospiraceae bacterium]